MAVWRGMMTAWGGGFFADEDLKKVCQMPNFPIFFYMRLEPISSDKTSFEENGAPFVRWTILSALNAL